MNRSRAASRANQSVLVYGGIVESEPVNAGTSQGADDMSGTPDSAYAMQEIFHYMDRLTLTVFHSQVFFDNRSSSGGSQPAFVVAVETSGSVL